MHVYNIYIRNLDIIVSVRTRQLPPVLKTKGELTIEVSLTIFNTQIMTILCSIY